MGSPDRRIRILFYGDWSSWGAHIRVKVDAVHLELWEVVYFIVCVGFDVDVFKQLYVPPNMNKGLVLKIV